MLVEISTGVSFKNDMVFGIGDEGEVKERRCCVYI